jgi:hypothetical protein
MTMNFFATNDTQPGVRGLAPLSDTPVQHWADFVDTIAVEHPEVNDDYSIGLPAHLKRRPAGLDMQGRFPEAAHAACEFSDDEARSLGWGAVLPAFLSIALVGACAAIVLLIKDFT